MVRRLSAYGIPGFWRIRWLIFRAFLFLLDRSFESRDKGKKELYQIKQADARFEVRRGTSDSFVIDEVWRKHDYGEQHNGIVLDIGANIGAFTVYAARTADMVIAIEASSENFTRLKRNVDLNSLSNTHVKHACVSSRPGVSALHYHETNNGMSSTTFKGPSKYTEQVKNVTFSDIFQRHKITHIDFVKCDVEGGEFDIFSGENLGFLGQIDKIALEVHCSYTTPKQVETLLLNMAKAGYRMRVRNMRFLMLTGTDVLYFDRPLG